MPARINWPKLIKLLRSSYKRGDGGLAADVGINESVLSRCVVRGVHSLDNGIALWNLSVDRMNAGKISAEKLRACVVRGPTKKPESTKELTLSQK